MKRKPKIRWSALTGVLTTLGGIAVTVVTHPDVIQATATRVGVSVAVVGAVVQAITKALVRDEHERY